MEQHVRTLSIELVARGHDVAVVTMHHKNQAKFSIDNGVRIYRIRASVQRLPLLFHDSGRQHTPPFPDPEMTLQLRKIIIAERPQIVHAHNWLVRSFLPLKRWSGARLVVTLHDYNLACATETLMYRNTLCNGPTFGKCFSCAVHHYGAVKGTPTVISNWLMGVAERRAVDRFLAVSQAVAEGNGLIDSGFSYTIIPNFLPDTLAQSNATAYLAQLPKEDFILFVGALGRTKGVEVLLRAYARLENPPLLVLIGYQTPDWSQFASLCSRNVLVFKGWPHDAVMGAWQRSMLAVAPSIWPEPCSTVVMEAMLTGLPVIATRIGGMTDLVEDAETGFLIQPGDVNALQCAMQRLLDDNQLRKKMGLAGQRKVVNFQISTVLPRIERVYQDVLSA